MQIPIALLFLTTLLVACPVHAEDWENTAEVGVLAGLTQPLLLGGGNLQLEGRYKRFVFDYSHGWSLDIPTAGDAAKQRLAMHLPYSTGMGIGYKLTEALDVRFEPKRHRIEMHYHNQQNPIISYRTVTFGLGAYYSYRPFQRRESPLRGMVLAASLRWWQNVWTDLNNAEYSYDNEQTGRSEVHRAANIGLANTPIVINVSIGYLFSL